MAGAAKSIASTPTLDRAGDSGLHVAILLRSYARNPYGREA